MMKNYITLFIFFLFFGVLNTYGQIRSEEKSEKGTVVMDNFVLNDAVQMFPNPVQNYLTVRSNLPVTRVEVYSLLGELIKEVNSNFSRIDLRQLNSGIYMVKIYSDQYSVTKKLIKK
jgi:hypothetical protein